MNRSELLFTKAQHGGTAEYTLTLLQPTLEKRRSIALAKLKRLFRDGVNEAGPYIVSVAELCNLDDIESEFAQTVKKGREARKELDDGEETRDQD